MQVCFRRLESSLLLCFARVYLASLQESQGLFLLKTTMNFNPVWCECESVFRSFASCLPPSAASRSFPFKDYNMFSCRVVTTRFFSFSIVFLNFYYYDSQFPCSKDNVKFPRRYVVQCHLFSYLPLWKNKGISKSKTGNGALKKVST